MRTVLFSAGHFLFNVAVQVVNFFLLAAVFLGTALDGAAAAFLVSIVGGAAAAAILIEEV